MRTPAPRAPGLAAPIALLLAIFVLAGCGGGTGGATPSTTTVTITPTVTPAPSKATSTTTPPPTPPQSYDQAVQHLATGTTDPARTTSFTSPSGNIYCDIYAGSPVRGCELRSGRIAPPTADYCGRGGGGAKDIGRVQFSVSGPTAVCNSDSIVTTGAAPLKYGSVAVAGSIACISESIGVTCLDSGTKKGFFLARSTFFIF